MKNPDILSVQEITRSTLFCIEKVHLRFNNGKERKFERLTSEPKGRNAVMVVAIADNGNFILIEEYAAGVNSYQLSLPKGLVEPSESIIEGANRELKEEAGYGANNIEYLTELSLSPNYMSYYIHVVIATNLYQEKIEGDEPEDMPVHQFSFSQLPDLIQQNNFSDARTIAALFVAKDKIKCL